MCSNIFFLLFVGGGVSGGMGGKLLQHALQPLLLHCRLSPHLRHCLLHPLLRLPPPPGRSEAQDEMRAEAEMRGIGTC